MKTEFYDAPEFISSAIEKLHEAPLATAEVYVMRDGQDSFDAERLCDVLNLCDRRLHWTYCPVYSGIGIFAEWKRG